MVHAVTPAAVGHTVVVSALYDELGVNYTAARAADPRIAAQLLRALGPSRTVLNVGAGAGAYEPSGLEVVAVEPSQVMIGQRPEGSAPVIQASAEALPFPDDAFDAAMAVLSDHHWTEREAGLRELRRVARRRVVIFNADPAQAEGFWLTRDYLRQFLDLIPKPYRQPGYWIRELEGLLGVRVRKLPLPIPGDCRDGFYSAYWRRPAAYLEPEVRAGISAFSRLDPDGTAAGLARLRNDLESGEWHRRNGSLLDLPELDLGYCLIIAELGDE